MEAKFRFWAAVGWLPRIRTHATQGAAMRQASKSSAPAQNRPAPGRTAAPADAPPSTKYAPHSVEGQAEQAFLRFDADGSGQLSLEEFTEAFKHGIGEMHKTGLLTPDLKHAGIGCTLDKISNGQGRHIIKITEVVPNGSLFRDGRVFAGDRITHISGKHVEEYPVSKILTEIVGPCATMIDLTVVRDTSQPGATVKISIERGTPIYWHFMDRIRPLEQQVVDLEQQVRNRDAEIARLKRQHEVELRDRDILHAAELEDRTNEWREQLARELKARDDSFAKQAKDYGAELLEQSRLHAAALARAQSDNAESLQQMSTDHFSSILKMKQDFMVSLQKVNEDSLVASQEHTAALQKMAQDHAAALKKLTGEHEHVIRGHMTALQKMSDDHAEALKKLVREHEESVRKVQSDMQRDAAKSAAEITERHHELFKKALLNFNEQVEALQEKFDAVSQQLVKERNDALDHHVVLHKQIQASLTTIEDLETASAALQQDHERLTQMIPTLKGEIGRLRQQKSQMIAQYAQMEHSLQDQLFDAIDQSNVYKAELDQFYQLPNPTGIGLIVETSTGLGFHKTCVVGVVPAMSAAACGVVSVGDLLLEVDGISVKEKENDEIKSMLSGRRGSRCSVTLRRASDGYEYTLVLKRGSWGPEHVAVSPEHLDMLANGSWPQPKSVVHPNRGIEKAVIF